MTTGECTPVDVGAPGPARRDLGPPATPVVESPPRVAFGYDRDVRSVADQLKEEDRSRIAALSPEQRVTLSLRLGETATQVLRAAQGLSHAEAVKLVRAIRSRGRRARGPASG